ncbi:MAG: DUF5666 domain-containing protein [Anaerolineales bacterium]
MSKKIVIPVILVLLASMVASGVALAQSGDDPGQPGSAASLPGLARGLKARLARLRSGSAVGQVATTSPAQLVIQNLSGGQHTYQVDGQTRFFDENGQPATVGDLTAGRWVVVQASRSGLTNWTARVVYLLPAGFNPPADLNLLVAGQLSGVNVESGTFSIQARSGKQWTFSLGDGAVFLGQNKTLSDLTPGMQTVVAGINAAQGESPTAYLVFARQRMVRYTGSIAAVDVANSTFTLQARRGGQNVIIQVDSDTHFRSKDGQYNSLADLQPGMRAVVQARQQGQDQWVAAQVAVATQAQITAYDLRLVGRIVSIDGDTLVVENLRGWQYTLQVTADTRYMGNLTGSSDLKTGMNVALGANEVNGVYQVQAILAPQRNRAPQPASPAPAT